MASASSRSADLGAADTRLGAVSKVVGTIIMLDLSKLIFDRSEQVYANQTQVLLPLLLMVSSIIDGVGGNEMGIAEMRYSYRHPNNVLTVLHR